MNKQPTIKYYARFDYIDNGKKTPKYVASVAVGYYPPMEQLKSKDGMVYVYLMSKLDDAKVNAPAMRLQAKNSLNLTGLKSYLDGGKLTGFAWGEPLQSETYGKDNKPNPFYKYKDDGLLFVIHQGEGNTMKPAHIEMIVLDECKVLAAAYCKQLMMGGFDAELTALRKQAGSI